MIDTGGYNQFVNVTKNAGQLYLAMAVNYSSGSSNQSVIRWMRVNAVPGSISVTKYDTIGSSDTTLGYFYPSTAGGSGTNPYQVINFSQSGSNTYPSTAVLTIDSTGAIASNYWNYQGQFAYTDSWAVESNPIGCTAQPCYRWGDGPQVLPAQVGYLLGPVADPGHGNVRDGADGSRRIHQVPGNRHVIGPVVVYLDLVAIKVQQDGQLREPAVAADLPAHPGVPQAPAQHRR